MRFTHALLVMLASLVSAAPHGDIAVARSPEPEPQRDGTQYGIKREPQRDGTQYGIKREPQRDGTQYGIKRDPQRDGTLYGIKPDEAADKENRAFHSTTPGLDNYI